MNNFAGLEKITPAIIKFPFEKILKACINLKLRRKLPSSIARLFALFIGIGLGFVFPEIGYLMIFMLNLFVMPAVSSSVITGITMTCSIVLSASALMYLTKKMFQSYYHNKIGVSNPELVLTKKDKIFLEAQYRLSNPNLDDDNVNKYINDINDKVDYLVNKIRLYKITKHDVQRKTAKYIINCLKRGDESLFKEYYEAEYIGKNKLGSNNSKKKSDRDGLAMSSMNTVSNNNKDAGKSASITSAIPTSKSRSVDSIDNADASTNSTNFQPDIYNQEANNLTKIVVNKDLSNKSHDCDCGSSKGISSGSKNANTNNNNSNSTVTFNLNLYGLKTNNLDIASPRSDKSIKKSAELDVGAEKDTDENDNDKLSSINRMPI